METAAISHRVADFLKQHPPFHAVGDGDLLELCGQGRVRFFEANEYIVWQGEPYQMRVFVIQQGTVSLWNEAGENAVLCDVRGPGDMLGIEQFNDGGSYAYSARSSSDVVVYVFPAIEFESLVLKYPYARRFTAAYSNVAGEYQSTEERRSPPNIFLRDLAGRKKLLSCSENVSIRDAARTMRAAGSDSIVVLDAKNRARAVLTPDTLMQWIEGGGGDSLKPVSSLQLPAPVTMATDASVTDGILEMGRAGAAALLITSDGTLEGRPNAMVTSRELQPVFGDQPNSIFREIPLAPDTQVLRGLNQRTRAFTLQHLTSAGAVDWLARFTALADALIVNRVISLIGASELPITWCLFGSSGRGESITKVRPQVLMILDGERDRETAVDAYRRLEDSLGECGYLPPAETPFPPDFYFASRDEWKQRYMDWVRDPILKEMYLAHPLFDVRCIHGNPSPWREIENAVAADVDNSFLRVLANDCLASLPPLTFFHDAVVDEIGEETAVFRLEHSALQPLVDVGRVFGMAARKVHGTSTLERFTMARGLIPEHESIFREAAETFRIVLWQQGRIGISQGTDGAELPPALLSRLDRQVLKSGFRSILRLLEFTADPAWLQAL